MILSIVNLRCHIENLSIVDNQHFPFPAKFKMLARIQKLNFFQRHYIQGLQYPKQAWGEYKYYLCLVVVLNYSSDTMSQNPAYPSHLRRTFKDNNKLLHAAPLNTYRNQLPNVIYREGLPKAYCSLSWLIIKSSSSSSSMFTYPVPNAKKKKKTNLVPTNLNDGGLKN